MRLRRHNRLLVAMPLVWVLWLLGTPPAALADAPGTRGEEPAPRGGAGGVGDWRGVQELPPHTVLTAPAAQLEPAAEKPVSWLDRGGNTGNWVMDAGMGIAGGALAAVNEALIVGVTALVVGGGKDCSGTSNIILCTPPELFFGDGEQAPASQPKGGGAQPLITGLSQTIAKVHKVLRPLAISLIGLLFVIRVGRMMTEGPASLAAEGKQLIVSFGTALAFTQSSEGLLKGVLQLLNGLHARLSGEGIAALLEHAGRPNAHLNLGVQITLLVLVIVLLLLSGKALLRVVHLTILIAVAPLMGALLMDRSTSPRFGQWVGKLFDVLLQQTAWVFFFAVGAGLFNASQAANMTDARAQIIANFAAAVVLGMAVGGESILAGIAGASGGPGGLVAGKLGSALSSRGLMRGARWTARTLQAGGRGLGDAAGSLGERSSAAPSGDPLKSRAGRQEASRGGANPAAARRYGRSSDGAPRAMLGPQRSRLAPREDSEQLTRGRSRPSIAARARRGHS
ncbi:MAG: hypothetical protein RLZZ387_1618 [Chloroflexota bacterium]|jgi:hypothetical protein